MSLIELLAYLLSQGAVVSFVINGLKRINFVAANPKIAAAVINVAAVTAAAFWLGDFGVTFVNFLMAVMAGLVATGVSVGTYEARKSL